MKKNTFFDWSSIDWTAKTSLIYHDEPLRFRLQADYTDGIRTLDEGYASSNEHSDKTPHAGIPFAALRYLIAIALKTAKYGKVTEEQTIDGLSLVFAGINNDTDVSFGKTEVRFEIRSTTASFSRYASMNRYACIYIALDTGTGYINLPDENDILFNPIDGYTDWQDF